MINIVSNKTDTISWQKLHRKDLLSTLWLNYEDFGKKPIIGNVLLTLNFPELQEWKNMNIIHVVSNLIWYYSLNNSEEVQEERNVNKISHLIGFLLSKSSIFTCFWSANWTMICFYWRESFVIWSYSVLFEVFQISSSSKHLVLEEFDHHVWEKFLFSFFFAYLGSKLYKK